MPMRSVYASNGDEEDEEGVVGSQDHSEEELSEDLLLNSDGEFVEGAQWADRDTAWRYVHQARPEDLVFFDNLSIAKDGGLTEVTGTKEPETDNLWYNSRYFSALVLVSFVFMNVYFIVRVDLHAIFSEEVMEEMSDEERTLQCGAVGSGGVCGENYLLTGGVLRGINWLAQRIFDVETENIFTPTQVICAVELFILGILLLQIVWRILQVIATSCLSACLGVCLEESTIKRWERQRWFAAYQLFLELIPQVAIFSAMKLLFFITPQILTLHLNTILFYDDGAKLPNLIWFIFTRGIACVIGFDSFLVKYRTANDMIMTDDLTFDHILGAVVLLNQILGVVQINWVIRDRLFRFVFGGEDGMMNQEEHVRMDTWNALVTHKIWKRYSNIFDRLALLLTFCDDDFQRLCLSETIAQKVQSKMDVPVL